MAEHYNLEFGYYPSTAQFNIPEIKPVYELDYPDRWVEFAVTQRNKHLRDKTGVHFYERDYMFNRVWNEPNKYIHLLSQYRVVASPDFSMYGDYPQAMQIWNLYRNCWCARFWQENGITVIPTVLWGDESTWDWCFSGMPKHSIITVSNVGNAKGKEKLDYFNKGYIEMLNRLEPKEIIMMVSNLNWNYEGNVHYIKWCRLKGEQYGRREL